MSKYQYSVRDFSRNNDELLLQETLFHNANGYLGVRGNLEEGYPEGYKSVRGQYINGFYNFMDMPQAEKLCGLIEEKQTMLNVVDTQSVHVFAGHDEISMFTGIVQNTERKLDMEAGVTKRSYKWSSLSTCKLNVDITRMTSFNVLPLFLMKYEVTSENYYGKIRFESSHQGEVMNFFDPSDPRVAGEACKHLTVEDVNVKDDISFITVKTTKSAQKATSAVKNVLSKDCKIQILEKGSCVTEILETDIEAGETVTLWKYTICCDSLRYDDTRDSASQIMKQVLDTPIKKLYEDQRQYLETFWDKCAIEVQGDKELNDAIHYNLYQLIQSVAKDDKCNIAAKGLSGEGYEGHYFWDTEMYIQPFFTLTASEISRNLIRYRYTILSEAKENAKILGHKKGAAYPWRTIMGKECSGYFPSGSAQYHISGDISYAIVAYYLATGDLELLEECGAEILIETARLWMDLGNFYHGKFHINEVTGPDEYTCLVNNNYYTNALAKYNLYWAVEAYELLKSVGKNEKVLANTGISETELDEFRHASENMYLPYDEELGINPQDDSFLQKKVWDVSKITEAEKPLLLHYHPMYLYRFQVCKQADTVLSHFILEDLQDIETMRRSFEYYEKVTTHDSSLSTCIYSIVAAKLGQVEKAYEYFGESAKLDLFNTHKNTKDGIHTANMGGTYMAIVYGFGGLRIKENGIYINPVLPKEWEAYQFRFNYLGTKIDVHVSRERCTVKVVEGESVRINLYGKSKMLVGTLVEEF